VSTRGARGESVHVEAEVLEDPFDFGGRVLVAHEQVHQTGVGEGSDETVAC